MTCQRTQCLLLVPAASFSNFQLCLAWLAAPFLSILLWAFLHSCLRFLACWLLLVAFFFLFFFLASHLCCSPSPSTRITQTLTLSSHSLQGEIFPDPGSIVHLQAISGHDIFFDASKLNNGSLKTSGRLKTQQNDLPGNLPAFLLDVTATPRMTFFQSPVSGAEKDLCAILNSSVISRRWKRDWPRVYSPKPSVARQFQNILSLMLQR